MFAVVLAGMLAGCGRPDASDVTSPSGRSLLGTTTGIATYELDETPPGATADPAGWDFQLLNARYARLENQQAAMQVVTRLQSEAGATMEVWLWSESGHVPLYWHSGTTTRYNGVFCFQLRLEDEGESLRLEDDQYYLTIGFRDQATGEWVVVKEQRVAGTVPLLDGATPGADSRVGSELLGCPRSVI